MKVFISGGAKSGKSSYAQDAAVVLAKGGELYYLATMIPTDGEDLERIRLHLMDRAGMGFETVECGRDILTCLPGREGGTFLIDSATALLQNAIFPPEKGYEMDIPAANRCADDLITFIESVKNAVVVSDYIYSDGGMYDEATEAYRKCLAGIDKRLCRVCDTVIEVFSGQLTIHKGEVPH